MPDADDALNLLTLGVQTRDRRLLYIVYTLSSTAPDNTGNA